MSSDGPSTPPDLRLLITPHRTPVLDSAPPPQAPWPCCDFTPRDGPRPSRSPPSRPPARLCSALTFRLRSTSPELRGAPNRQFKHAEAPGPSSFGLIRSGSSTAFSSPCLDPRSLAPLPSPLHSLPLFAPSLQSRGRGHPSEPLPASCTCRPSRPFHLSCLSTPRSYWSPTLPLPTPTRKVRPGVHEQKRLPRGSPVW